MRTPLAIVVLGWLYSLLDRIGLIFFKFRHDQLLFHISAD